MKLHKRQENNTDNQHRSSIDKFYFFREQKVKYKLLSDNKLKKKNKKILCVVHLDDLK